MENTAYRILFWLLFVGVMAMRIYFSIQVRRSGERLLPDRQAIEREGRGMFLRVPREEKMMLDAFGEAYRAYMQRTGRFFPKWQ